MLLLQHATLRIFPDSAVQPIGKILFLEYAAETYVSGDLPPRPPTVLHTSVQSQQWPREGKL